MIGSSRWHALLAAGGIALLCLAPVARGESKQTPAGCRADCTIGKQLVGTLSGVEIASLGGRVVRDGRGRYVANADDVRVLLFFDASGRLLKSPRPAVGPIGSIFVNSTGTVHAYAAGALLTFDANRQVTSRTDLPHPPALMFGGGSFLVVRHINTPGSAGHPLHVMSKDGRIVRSFGADDGPFRSADIFKNSREVCLNPDGTIWSIAVGGRLLERWDPSTGRRVAQVTVKSTWFRESSRPAPEGKVANPLIMSIWAEKDIVWILYRVPDPKWTPKVISEKEELAATPRERAETEDRRSDWVLEAVRTDTGAVIAMKTFDRQLLRREGSFAIASAASANRAGGVELWTPTLFGK